jgi:deoxyribodipyrimidine photolyase-related protein
MTTLVLVLGDQLSPNLSSLAAADKADTVVLIAEVWDEATYVRHHKKKIAFIFSAMRHFAEALRLDGWTVDYVKLDDGGNSGSFTGEVARAIARHRASRVVVTEAGEWRVMEMMRGWAERFGIPVDILDDTRFIASHAQFQAWAEGKKQLRMEFFYRDMRRSTGLLMDGQEPVGGRWNFDAENRKPASGELDMPQPPRFPPDTITEEVLALVSRRFHNHFGDLKPFWFAVTREQAEQAFEHFVQHALPYFGDYQDAMLQSEKFLFHAVVSPYMNIGFLDPLAMCRRVEEEYVRGRVPLNCAEGFIRQILGWREYVRGIYWLKMPGYPQQNFFGNRRPLPGFYWTGETEMNCMRHAVMQTREEAYAHHIQRLMVTGNFALIAGIDPYFVHEWYLIVYADAYEWVEAPNTVGMSLFADGGLLGSKPYAAGGNYINKMSDYCGSCHYDVKQRTGPRACPFNYLYWDFLIRNRGKLDRNQRLQPMYRTIDRMGDAKKDAIRESAATFLDTIAPSPDWP